MVVGAGGAVAIGAVEGRGSEEDDGDSDEAGGARGSELAMLSRRNLPSWSRKSLSLPVVLVLMVESGLDRRHYIMRCRYVIYSVLCISELTEEKEEEECRESVCRESSGIECREEGWLAAQIGRFPF